MGKNGEFVDVKGGKRVHTIVLDWDGTLVEAKWPDMGDWLPGATMAIRKFHSKGVRMVVFSARLNPYDPWTGQSRDKAEVATEYQKVRAMLDFEGFGYVDIWMVPGKPGATVYVDDRAERYNRSPHAWKVLSDKILMRLGLEDPQFPEFEQQEAEQFHLIQKQGSDGEEYA